MIQLIQKFIFDDELLDRLADKLLEKLGMESSALPILRKQLAEIEKGIDNIVNAIQAGIFTSSTKQRLEQLEAEKSEISVQILKEEISKPSVTKEEILFYLIKYRKLNMKQLDHRRRLIDSFVNAIYLFDDYLVITFNYKEGTKTITFAEVEGHLVRIYHHSLHQIRDSRLIQSYRPTVFFLSLKISRKSL